jgi:hypothetical protein
MRAATSASGRPCNGFKAVAGMAGHRAFKGRAWRALAILYGVHGHPLPYTYSIRTMSRRGGGGGGLGKAYYQR